MDSGSQTSFIPKKPISVTTSSYEDRGVSIVTIICVIVFFGAVALSVGSYLYRGVLTKSLQDKKDTLEKAKSSFDLDTIKDLKRLDTRIETAKKLIETHIAVSAYFSLLEDVTLKTVRFSELTINSSSETTSAIPGASQVAEKPLKFLLKGVAKSYSGVAIQSDLFTRAKGFKEPIFSDLVLDDRGNVSFGVEALLDPQTLRYRASLGAAGAKRPTTTSTPATSTTTTSTSTNPKTN